MDLPQPTEPRHPIRLVAERTGLTPDVIRVWERRYGAVEPQRNASGHRLFSDREINRLRLLARVTAEGRNIGHVASLTDEELERMVRADRAHREPAESRDEGAGDGASGPPEVDPAQIVETCLEAVRRLDSEGLRSTLSRALALAGGHAFLEKVVGPLFRAVGDEWHEGRLSPGQEHLATSVAIPLLAPLHASFGEPEDAPCLLVGTAAGERHELGAQLVGATAALDGWRVVYLGADLPPEELEAAARQARPSLVAVSVVMVDDPAGTARQLATLRNALPPDVRLIVGGGGATRLRPADLPPDVELVGDLPSLRRILAEDPDSRPRSPRGSARSGK